MTTAKFGAVLWSLVRGGFVSVLSTNPLQWRERFSRGTEATVILPMGCKKCSKAHFCPGSLCGTCKRYT